MNRIDYLLSCSYIYFCRQKQLVMRNTWVLILVAILTLFALIFIFNPTLLKDVWLWLVGLVGPIIALLKKGSNSIESFLKRNGEVSNPKTSEQSPANKNQEDLLNGKIADLEQKLKNLTANKYEPPFEGTTITVLRYMDDGESTLGLLFYNQSFHCYTLEDTFRPVKIYGETRIPAGNYKLDFLRVDNELTLKYRTTRDWFEYHLHINDVPGFEGILIHTGSTHVDTKGCLLVASGIDASNATLNISNSRTAFELLYKKLKIEIDGGKNVRIKIFDENWFEANRIIEQIPSTHKTQ